MSPRLTIRRVRRVRLVTRPQFVTRSALTDARVSALRSARRAARQSPLSRGASGRRRGQMVRYLVGVVRRRADER